MKCRPLPLKIELSITRDQWLDFCIYWKVLLHSCINRPEKKNMAVILSPWLSGSSLKLVGCLKRFVTIDFILSFNCTLLGQMKLKSKTIGNTYDHMPLDSAKPS